MIRYIIYFVVLITTAGCNTLNPSIMFKTPFNFKFSTIDTTGTGEYQITTNDVLDFKIYTNEGFKLVDVSMTAGQQLLTAIQYLVESDGNVKFPVIGRIPMRGMTVREAEKVLEEKYSVYYNKPFVLLKVTNKRVMIFPGSGGSAKVIKLENENTTLIEALALSGGISSTGKAKKVKLIRNNGKENLVQLMDLSTIDGLKQAGIVLQSNDIIYVDPVPKISQGILAEITPVIGILTSFLLVYSIIFK